MNHPATAPKTMNRDRSWTVGRIVTVLVIAAVIFFGIGVWLCFLWDMPVIDSVTFLLCLGVVYIIGASGLAAWKSPRIDDGPADDLGS